MSNGAFCGQDDQDECETEWENGRTLAEDGTLIPVNRCPECGMRWDIYVLGAINEAEANRN
jgi:hypothetical protein